MVAQKYAKALFETSQKRNITGKVLVDLTEICKVIRETEKLRKLLGHPRVAAVEKVGTIRMLSGDKEAFRILEPFFVQILKTRRLSMLSGILMAFGEMVDEAMNIKRIAVKSARPLDNNKKEALKKALSKAVKGKLLLDFKEDPDLLGGMQIKIKDIFFDASVKGRIASLAKVLQVKHGG
ncbi:ATP synthase F1 subunit delta [Elusimicrobiota bacterium]